MTDYSELVKALRCKRDDCEGCGLAFFDNDEGWMCQYAAKDDDAAAAIESLQAEVDALKHDIERYVQMNTELLNEPKRLRERNNKLHAELERWVSAAEQAGEPKRGKWIETEEKEWGIYPFKKHTCSVCDCKIDHIFMLACMDYFDDRDTVFHYCPNCGAKMEVQDAD